MPSEDEIKIIFSVLNTAKIDQAREAIEKEESAIRHLGAALAAGSIGQAQFDAATAASAQKIQASQAQIKASMKSAFNPQSILEFSRATEDAQYGIAGVLNNIPGLIAAMGGGAGLAGAISLAAVGLTVLGRHWDDLMGVFGQGHVKTQAEEMEELGKKTKITADEAERLARASAPGAKVKELRDAPTAAESKRDQAVTQAVIEAGYDDVVAGLKKVDPKFVASQGDAAVAKTELDKAKKDHAQYLNGDFLPGSQGYEEGFAAVTAAQEKLDKAMGTTAEELVAIAAKARLFPKALEKLQGMVEANPQAFGPNGNALAKALKDAMPPDLAPKGPNLNPHLKVAAAGPDDAAFAEDQREDQERIRGDEARENARLYEIAREQDEGLTQDVKDDKAERIDRANAAEKDRLDREFKLWAKENDRDPQTGEKVLTGGAKAEADESDEQYERRRQEEERKFREEFANWQVQGNQKIADEDQAAQQADAMTEWGKKWDREHQNAQVFNGPAALRDAIQTAQRKDKDPTAVEQLTAQREIAANTKRMAEAKEAQAAARAG